MTPPIIVNVFVTVFVTTEVWKTYEVDCGICKGGCTKLMYVSNVVRTVETCLVYRSEDRSGCGGHGIVIRQYLTSIFLEELEMVDQEVGFGERERCVGDILATGFDAG
jgi:hypothetical protein